MVGKKRKRSGEKELDKIFVPKTNFEPQRWQIGGKAYNLARLSAKGLPVPSWFALTTSFFEEFMGKPDIAKLDKILNSKLKKSDDAKKMSEKLTDLISQKDFYDALKILINEQLNYLNLNNSSVFLSVRSSAIDEDSPKFSFAGQLDSFLYQKNDEHLYDAVRKCFISAYSERVMQYRFNNKLPLTGIRPAVIIQQMIFGEVAGVMFTGNPLTNNSDETVISSVWGIGEGLVSGALDSDTWIIDENGKEVSKQILSQTEYMTFDKNESFGSVMMPMPPDKHNSPTLSSQEIQSLWQLGKRIEAVQNYIPQDIEFCLYKGEIFILQSRPITQMSHIHKNLKKTILDNSNIIESFPGRTQPFTFSFASTVYDTVYRQFYSVMGVSSQKIEQLSSIFRNMLSYIDGRIYYNLNSWYGTLRLLPGYRLNKEFMEKMMGVKSTGDTTAAEKLTFFEQWFIEIPNLVRGIIKIIYSFFTLDKKINFFISNFKKVTRPYINERFENMTNREIIDVYDYLQKNVLKNWKAPIVNDFFTMIFYGVLSKMIKSLPISEKDGLQNNLLSGQGDLESTKPTREIIKLANWIRQDKQLTQLFINNDEKTLIEIIISSENEKFDEVHNKVLKYIETWGSRCMNELKLEELSLKEEPAFLFTMLKNYLLREPINLDEMARRERKICESAEKKVLQHFKGLKKRLFLSILNNSRKTIKYREKQRFMRTQIFGIIRAMFRAIGDNFVKDGLIKKKEDIFFLHIDEVFSLIEGRSLNNNLTKEIVKLRKKDFDASAKTVLTERLVFYGDISANNFLAVSSEDIKTLADDESGNSFQGIPCSPGIVEAPAKCVFSPEDAHLNGEILVAKRTDPGWVPLFPSISGLIIERGSVLSHSAVVGREMGIPTIVGLRNITKKIHDGDEILMNGSTGKVALVK